MLNKKTIIIFITLIIDIKPIEINAYYKYLGRNKS